MTTATAKLRHYAATRYEIAIIDATGKATVVGYSARKTKTQLMNVARENGKAIAAMLTEEQMDAPLRFIASKALVVGGCVHVAFTGRTEQQAFAAA